MYFGNHAVQDVSAAHPELQIEKDFCFFRKKAVILYPNYSGVFNTSGALYSDGSAVIGSTTYDKALTIFMSPRYRKFSVSVTCDDKKN